MDAEVQEMRSRYDLKILALAKFRSECKNAIRSLYDENDDIAISLGELICEIEKAWEEMKDNGEIG